LAKECATFVASGGVGQNPNTSVCTLVTGTNVAATYAANWSAYGQTVAGLRCLSATHIGAVSAAISVLGNGNLSCTLS
jgi:hypothetical protein